MNIMDNLKLDDNGLICAVIQHVDTGQLLMVGYMNEESLGITLKEQKACFWSRSRQELWLKGDTSGNYLHVKEIRVDCDCDALLLRCQPDGPITKTVKRIGGLIDCIFANICECNMGAGFTESSGDSDTNSTGSTGYQSHAVC